MACNEKGMEGTVRGFVDDIAEESFDEFDDGSDEVCYI